MAQVKQAKNFVQCVYRAYSHLHFQNIIFFQTQVSTNLLFLTFTAVTRLQMCKVKLRGPQPLNKQENMKLWKISYLLFLLHF